MTDKIINTFQRRRELDKAVANLAQAENALSLSQAARHIVHTYSTRTVVATLIKYLNTENGQLRGGLGQLAQLLPRDVIIPALRRNAGNRQHDNQLRFNAVTILENFLGEEIPPELLSDIQNQDDVVFQSLRDAVDYAEQNRHVLIEYLFQMREHGEETAFMVLRLIEQLHDTEQVELLRLLAQDDRKRVANQALTQLEQLDIFDAGPQIVRALHILQFTLPPNLTQRVQRTLRKYQFSGVRYESASTQGWRALIGEAEASGSQTIWLLNAPEPENTLGTFISLVVNLDLGILQTYVNEEMVFDELPAAEPIGTVHSVRLDNGDSMRLLESPFDYARWLIQVVLSVHWEGKNRVSLFGEYILYNDLIWQFDAPQVDASLMALVQTPSDQKTSTQIPTVQGRFSPPVTHMRAWTPTEDETAQSTSGLSGIDEAAEQLLSDPVMQGWFDHSYRILQTILSDASIKKTVSIPLLTSEILQSMSEWSDGRFFFQGMALGLRLQAAWLQIRGDAQQAQNALQLAQGFRSLSPAQNPFLRHLYSHALEELVD